MQPRKIRLEICGILAALLMTLMLPRGAVAANNTKVLYKFKGSPDAAAPMGNLIFDHAGNLYGTTFAGGLGAGTVFKLAPNSDGSWTESVLYAFCSLTQCADGAFPMAGLILHGADLYGTTSSGGSGSGGVVFKLAPNSKGSWTESILYSFCSVANCIDGAYPFGGLTSDAVGNLYGTTQEGGGVLNCNGGSLGCGTVFKLVHKSGGSWSETVLYNFTNGSDGGQPLAGVILDTAKNIYGTTSSGGNNGQGVVFKLDTSSIETVLHTFEGIDGSTPVAGLIFDAVGNLYSTTYVGGENEEGTVFKLRRNTNGNWTERLLHSFRDHPAAGPVATVTFDGVGNLYGTASDGAVFKLVRHSNGGWDYRTLVFFSSEHPYGGLIFDRSGNLYGSATNCFVGKNCLGIVFEITP
jgi:uncharacterized repeat protein (TIGR03803 family)